MDEQLELESLACSDNEGGNQDDNELGLLMSFDLLCKCLNRVGMSICSEELGCLTIGFFEYGELMASIDMILEVG